ncbi:hypothetical protein AGMMS50229_20430 [Campylobacterota bacterium]|nr:hypothetical protein AGMMS50229_20430 [Campylobacterota bacterium]
MNIYTAAGKAPGFAFNVTAFHRPAGVIQNEQFVPAQSINHGAQQERSEFFLSFIMTGYIKNPVGYMTFSGGAVRLKTNHL